MIRLRNIKEGTTYVVVHHWVDYDSYRIGVGQHGVLRALADFLAEMHDAGFYEDYLDEAALDAKETDAQQRRSDHWARANELDDEYQRMVDAGLDEAEFVSLREMKGWVEVERDTAVNLGRVIKGIRHNRAVGAVISQIVTQVKEGRLDLEAKVDREATADILPRSAEATVGMFIYYFLTARLRWNGESLEIVETEVYR